MFYLDQQSKILLAIAVAIAIVMCLGKTNREYFCQGYESPQAMCQKLAHQNCKIPTYPNNECYLRNYQQCYSQGKSACDCEQLAAVKCSTSPQSPAEGCFKSINQKCLAGHGLDPDRA